MNTKLLILTMLSSFLFTLCLSQACDVATFQDVLGVGTLCDCIDVPDTTVLLNVTVDVDADCLRDCVKSDSGVQGGCRSKSSTQFTQAIGTGYETCCGSCGGILSDGICKRAFLPSRPIPSTPSSGCLSKVRELQTGISYQCKCAPDVELNFDTFVATGVDDDCIKTCSNQQLQSVCTVGNQSGNFTAAAGSLADHCCDVCGGTNLDDGKTCGFGFFKQKTFSG